MGLFCCMNRDRRISTQAKETKALIPRRNASHIKVYIVMSIDDEAINIFEIGDQLNNIKDSD